MTQTGGCLCGAVRYELDGETGPLVDCHCRFCRRAHGAAFVTSMLVATDRIRFVSGEDAIRHHSQRFFCGVCATRLFNRVPAHPAATMLIVASLDDPPSTPSALHVNLESKAPWYEILDSAPRFDALPPDVDSTLEKMKTETKTERGA
jgi:hypothetical protein